MEYERPANLFFRFEELRIYNKALDYVSWVYANTQMFPDSEKRGITAKFITAAQSVAINIAKGSGRNKTEFIFYLRLAKSSIRECVVLTTICRRLEFLSDKEVEESRIFLMEMTRMLGALITSLRKNEQRPERQEYNDRQDFNMRQDYNNYSTDDEDELPEDTENLI
jgi:four helix bundle protein